MINNNTLPHQAVILGCSGIEKRINCLWWGGINCLRAQKCSSDKRTPSFNLTANQSQPPPETKGKYLQGRSDEEEKSSFQSEDGQIRASPK